jgi:ribonuclease HI
LSGGEKATTNNRMELEGLRALNQPCDVEVVTDPQYVQRGMSEHVAKWETNGWQTCRGAAVANQELWQELVSFARDHQTHWRWVRGHGATQTNNGATRWPRKPREGRSGADSSQPGPVFL